MSERAAMEVETLTIRIPMRLQRRGGRKLIMTPEGAAAPGPKPRRDETLVKALVRAHRWRPTSAGSCRSPAWRRTSWRRSWTGGSRRG
jgi:hypothetical protein